MALIRGQIFSALVNAIPHTARSRIRTVPGIAAGQRWFVNWAIAGSHFVHRVVGGPADGLSFDITLPQDKAIWTGNVEPQFVAEIIKRVEPGDICYDVGGHRGYMAGIMAVRNGGAPVFTFEPLPDNWRPIRRFCELNPRLNVVLMPYALGNRRGTATLGRMADPSMAKISESRFQESAQPAEEIEVPIAPIDDLSIPRPRVIKIDVEGAEMLVLAGARRTLAEDRPRLFIEAHSDALEAECRSFLEPLGYSISRLESVTAPEAPRHLVCLA